MRAAAWGHSPLRASPRRSRPLTATATDSLSKPAARAPPRRARRSGGSRGPGSGRSASCGRSRAGAGSWRAGRGRGPGPSTALKPRSSVSPSVMPGLMPPPASHMVKAFGMMVAAVVAALHHRRAAELAAPDDQRVVEQAALLEVLDQRGAGLVGVLAVLLEVLRPGCRAGPRPRGRAGRSARRARPAGGRAGSCWRTTACPARRRTSRDVLRLLATGPSAPGALDCMRKAISNELMRVAISGSPTTSSRCWFSASTASSESRCSSASTPGGFDRYSTGSPPLRNGTP